jgi:hypothetical protein
MTFLRKPRRQPCKFFPFSSCITSFCFILRRNRLGLEQHGPKSGRRHFAQHFQARGHRTRAAPFCSTLPGTWSHDYRAAPLCSTLPGTWSHDYRAAPFCSTLPGTWSHDYKGRAILLNTSRHVVTWLGPRHFAQHFQARGHMTRAAPFWIYEKNGS